MYFILNDTPTPEIYTLSLHDALPILVALRRFMNPHDSSAVDPDDLGSPDTEARQLIKGAEQTLKTGRLGDAIARASFVLDQLRDQLDRVEEARIQSVLARAYAANADHGNDARVNWELALSAARRSLEIKPTQA